MGKRLSRIITRTGDDGTTGLADGSRIAKNSLRIQALGDADELNSILGLVLTEPGLPTRVTDLLTRIQHELFELGGELSLPGGRRVTPELVQGLEAAATDLNASLPPLEEFILPGGSRPAALCHLARAVCRRAERSLVALAQQETVAPPLLHYLNRLSDLLFIVARVVNRELGRPDVLWRPRPAPPRP